MPTFREQYDKIIGAYFRDEIKPMDSEFCFCGTLKGDINWRDGDNIYSMDEYNKMEDALLFLGSYHNYDKLGVVCYRREPKRYEDILFEGLCNAIEVLKQIHIERGEVIDEVPVFTKRTNTKQLIKSITP